jgi:hypothetical protein
MGKRNDVVFSCLNVKDKGSDRITRSGMPVWFGRDNVQNQVVVIDLFIKTFVLLFGFNHDGTIPQ